MDIVATLALVACALLVLAGLAKVLSPAATSGALRAVSLPSSIGLVRTIGVGEVVLGIGAGASGSRIAMAIVAAAYLCFTGFVALALRSGRPVQSCGCFGAVDTPPSWIHLVVTSGFAIIAGWCAVAGTPSMADLIEGEPLAGVPYLAAVAAVTYLFVVVLTVVPTWWRARPTQ